MLTLKHRMQPNKEEVAAKVMDGEAILINLSNGVYYSMGKAGAMVWELVEQNYSVEEMIEAVAARYEVSAKQVQTDVEQLVRQLLEEKLVLAAEDGAAREKEQPQPVKQKEPYESPQLNIYRDMGYLLALDPPTPGLDLTPWKEPGEKPGK